MSQTVDHTFLFWVTQKRVRFMVYSNAENDLVSEAVG